MADSVKRPDKAPLTGSASPSSRRKASKEIKQGEDPLSSSKAADEPPRVTDEVDARHKGSPPTSRHRVRSGAIVKPRGREEEEAATIGGGEKLTGKEMSGDAASIVSTSLGPQTVMNGMSLNFLTSSVIIVWPIHIV